MAKPKWLRSSRKSWEKIGYIKLATVWIHRNGYSDDFVERMRDHIRSTVQVPYSSQFEQWLASNGLPKAQETEEIPSGHGTINTQLQYWWAFNTINQTGWLSHDAVEEYFQPFPRKIEVVDESFGLTELGHTLLLGFIPRDEVAAWEGKAISTLSPLVLTQMQKVFFIHAILKVDGDFIISLLEQWVDQFGTATFTYLDAGNLMPIALDNMASHFSSSVVSSDDQQEMSKIAGLSKTIAKQAEVKIETQGSGSSREQISIPRLEWLVDLGLLTKEGRRRYRFTKQGLILAKELTTYYRSLLSQHYPEDCLSKLIDHHLFGPAMEFLCGHAKKAGASDGLNLLKDAHENLKGALGYVLLRSLLLLINGRQAETEMPCFIEYDDALQIVEAEHRDHPKSIYYTVDRMSNEHQVKFSL